MSKTTVRFDHFRQLESGYRFNMDRIYEMHNILRRVASLQDMPNCSNPIVLQAIKDCQEYVAKWEALKESYPCGVPVVQPFIEVPLLDSI
jgi:hypothetical protein